jgi:hypothetical protein
MMDQIRSSGGHSFSGIVRFLAVILVGALAACAEPMPDPQIGPVIDLNRAPIATAMPPSAQAPASTATSATTPIPTADPETTRLLEAAKELARSLIAEQDMVTTGEACDALLATRPGCVILHSVAPIARPEWRRLFPEAQFFLIKTTSVQKGYEEMLHGGGFRTNDWIVAIQKGQRYEVGSFPRLLDANSIVIGDENREQVAQAFVLMTLPYYIEHEIRFSEAKEVDVRGAFSFERFNYGITAWTKLQGLKVGYLFNFENGRVLQVGGSVVQQGVGEHIPVPPVPSGITPNFLLRLQYDFFQQ